MSTVPNACFRGVEGAPHGIAIEDVGRDGGCPPAGLADALGDRGEAFATARDQRDCCARLGQHFRKALAEPARRAGDECNAAGEVEQPRCGH